MKIFDDSSDIGRSEKGANTMKKNSMVVATVGSLNSIGLRDL